jgi:hypothetical protein
MPELPRLKFPEFPESRGSRLVKREKLDMFTGLFIDRQGWERF